MSSLLRLFFVVLLGLVLVVGTAVGASVAAVYRAGTISVEVRDLNSHHVSLRVPATLVDLALACVPEQVVREATHEALPELAREVRPYWPVVREIARELHRCPDAVFVEVTSRGDHVVVRKSGNHLLVQVRSGHEEIDVSVPLRTVMKLLERVEDTLL